MTDYITPITVHAESGRMINLGRAGEHLATTVSFNVANWLNDNDFDGNGDLKDEYSFTLFVQQNGVGYYVQPVIYQPTSSNRTVRWPVMNYNTQTVGLGKCELMLGHLTEYVKDNVIYGYYNSSDKKFYKHYSSSTYSDEIEGKKDYIYVDQGTVEQNKYYYSGDETTPYVLDNNLQINQTQIIKSVIYDIVVTNAVDADAENDIPSVIETWLNQVTENMTLILNAQGYAQNARDAATAAENSATQAHLWTTGDDQDETQPGSTNNTKYYAENAENFANLAEAFAKGTINGDPVESGETGYHDNAKYYRDALNNPTLSLDNPLYGNPAVTGTYNPETNKFNFSFTIPKDNAIVINRGLVSSVSDLENISDVEIGDAVGVGTQSNFNIWIYNDSQEAGSEYGFINFGSLSGITATSYYDDSSLNLPTLNIRKYASFSDWETDYGTQQNPGNQGRNDVVIIPPSALTDKFLPIPANPQDGTVLGYDSNDGWIGIEPLNADLINITDEVVFGGTALITSGGVYTALTNKQDTLPSQTSNNGKYLTTNGTTMSWGAVDTTPTNASINLITSGAVYTATTGKQSQIKKTTSGSIAASSWTGNGPYTYNFNKAGINTSTRIEIDLTTAQYTSLINTGVLGIQAESGNGTITITTIGAKPTTDMEFQLTLMEVDTL